MSTIETDQIKNEVVKILEDMTSDWDIDVEDGFKPETRLVNDLSFESVEIVQLMVAIEQYFKLERMATSNLLMEDGRYVDDVSIQQIVDFLARDMNKS